MATRAFLLALLLTALSAGCVAEDDAAAAIPAGEPPQARGAGEARSHEAAERTQTDVAVDRDGSGAGARYTASRTVTYENDFGGASRATVSLSTGAGGVTARAWDQGGYKTTVVLRATAPTADAARAALERLAVQHGDRVASGTLTLTTKVLFPGQWEDGVSYAGLVTANLPRGPAYTLALDAGSGGASTTGLGGPAVSAGTGSGGVHIEGAFGRMHADTGSGGIELLGTANSVVADTGSGGVVARLRPAASGAWVFDAGSGDIEVTLVRGSGVGVDAQASNGSGSIDVDLSGGQPIGEQDDDDRHVRTAGYAEAPVRIALQAASGSGDIRIRDA